MDESKSRNIFDVLKADIIDAKYAGDVAAAFAVMLHSTAIGFDRPTGELQGLVGKDPLNGDDFGEKCVILQDGVKGGLSAEQILRRRFHFQCNYDILSAVQKRLTS